MDISEKKIKKFKRAAKALNAAILECKKDNPKCFAYLDGNSNMCLLDGSIGIGSEVDGRDVQDTILAIEVVNSACGDW